MEKKKSGFDAPAIGTLLPKGTTFRKNPDGTVTPVPPKTGSETKEKQKAKK